MSGREAAEKSGEPRFDLRTEFDGKSFDGGRSFAREEVGEIRRKGSFFFRELFCGGAPAHAEFAPVPAGESGAIDGKAVGKFVGKKTAAKIVGKIGGVRDESGLGTDGVEGGGLQGAPDGVGLNDEGLEMGQEVRT